MTIPSSKLTKLLDGVYECRDGQCTLREQGYGYKLMPSAKYSVGQFGLDVPFSTSLDIDERQMSVRFPFADGGQRDGVGDLLEVEGIDLSRHKKNPLVLWDHAKTYDKPIALAAEYNEDSGQYDIDKYTVEIDPILRTAFVTAYFYRGKGMNGVEKAKDYEHSLFCEQIFDMMAKGLVRAGSIGYQVVDARELPPDYRTGTPKGLHLLKTLMLEASAVVLPANGDTVRKMLDMPKSCGKPLSPWLIKSLKPYAPERKAFMATGEKANSSGIRVVIKPYRDPEFGKTYGIFDLGGKLLIGEFSSWSEAEKGADRAKYIITKTEKSIERIPGGLASGKNPADFDPEQLEIGMKVELEHSGDADMAREIAMDHLIEDSDYYRKLAVMEGKSYANNFLESRDDYENPLSDSDVPNAKWKPGEGAMKELRSKYRKKGFVEKNGQRYYWFPSADQSGYGPYGTEEEAKKEGERRYHLDMKERPGIGDVYRSYDGSPTLVEIVQVRPTTLTVVALDKNRQPFGQQFTVSRSTFFQHNQKVKTMSVQTESTGGALRKPPATETKGYDETDTPQEAYINGKNDCRWGVGKDRNPYKNSNLKAQWLRGWTEYNKEMEARYSKYDQKAMTALRKQYRTSKGLRRRLRKSIPGAASMHVSEKDMDAARKLAGEKGVKFERMGETKVKLIGPDEAIDEVAKAFGRRVKAMAIATKALYDMVYLGRDRGLYGELCRIVRELPNGKVEIELDEGSRYEVRKEEIKKDKGKTMSKVKTKALPEQIEDVEEKDMDNPNADEPFGSQSLRHYRQKLMDDMAETEGHLKLQDHEPTKKILTKMQEHRADMLDEIESTHAKCYKDLPQFEADADPEEGEEELEEVAEAKEFDPLDDDEGTPADSDLEDEPTPEEVIEGMELVEDEPDVDQVKQLKGIKTKRIIPAKRKSHQCGKCAKAMEDEKKEKDYPIDTPVPEQAIEDVNLPDSAKDFKLADHEKKGIGEAGDYLKDLGEPNSIHDDESRMKAYHYAKTLEGIGQIEEHAKESAGAAMEDAEEAINNEGVKSQIPGDLDYWQEEADEPEHVKMCKGASSFLKQMSTRKDFGDPHREEAKSWHKRLKDLVETGDPLGSEEADEMDEEMGIPSPEDSASKTYEPGEMGEKDADEDDKEDKRMKRKGMNGTKGFVYSIIMDVSPDAAKNSSYRAGKWEADFADTEAKARQMADSFNSHTQLPGLRYYVEKVDEESPKRKPPHRGKAMPADDEKKDKEKRLKKAAEPKEEDLKALAQSTQRNKSVLANLNRTLASLNGMI